MAREFPLRFNAKRIRIVQDRIEERRFLFRYISIKSTDVCRVVVQCRDMVTLDEIAITVLDRQNRVDVHETDPEFGDVCEFIDKLPNINPRWRDIMGVMTPSMDPIDVLIRRQDKQ